MKKFDTLEPVGYKFDTSVLTYISEMVEQREAAIARMVGHLTIVYGVELDPVTNTVSDGVIAYNDSLLLFSGGALQTKIAVKQIKTTRPDSNGTQKNSYITTIAEFGEDSLEVFNYADLKRYYSNQPIYKEIKYIGASVTNADLPLGWFIADGQNGTDDLRSKFIVGEDSRDVDYNTIGKYGGEKKHTLLASELPKLTSTNFYIADAADGYPNGSGDRTGTGGDNAYLRKGRRFKTADLGANGQAMENRPPYYVMKIIQFIGV